MLAAFPPWARTTCVPNGVRELTDTPPLSAEQSPRINGEFLVGSLGRVTEEKGIPELLEVARRCLDPSMRFAVAGAGDLVDHVRTSGLANLRYVGYVRESERYLRSLDVYLQASRNEGLSMALLEAMRAGIPIVATDVGATREAIRDGESGLLVPPRCPTAILDAISALRSDPSLAATLGAGARHCYEREFRMRRQHEHFLELYATGSASTSNSHRNG